MRCRIGRSSPSQVLSPTLAPDFREQLVLPNNDDCEASFRRLPSVTLSKHPKSMQAFERVVSLGEGTSI